MEGALLLLGAPALACLGAVVLPSGWPLRGLVLAVGGGWLWLVVSAGGAGPLLPALSLVSGGLVLGLLMRLLRLRADRASPRGRVVVAAVSSLALAAALGAIVLTGG